MKWCFYLVKLELLKSLKYYVVLYFKDWGSYHGLPIETNISRLI